MKKIIFSLFVLFSAAVMVIGQQLPNASFEDWSAPVFDKCIQPAVWHPSNVVQFGLKFNFAHQVAGHSGRYAIMACDQKVGAMGITEVSPSYITLGQPWVYVPSIMKIGQATAGTYGGVAWSYRPDTMEVWIKRTGEYVTEEDFHLLYYAWSGTAKSSHYKNKKGDCTTVEFVDEESDIRRSTDGNECGTDRSANQIAEGWVWQKKAYPTWTCMKVPIYYCSDNLPEKMNIIFSASNYPNFRSNKHLYEGSSLYVDDVRLIYSSKIQYLYVNGVLWKAFNPNETAVQTCLLSKAEKPEIEAVRGAGELTNSKGESSSFVGRRLNGKEMLFDYKGLNAVSTITVKAEDGSSASVYKIKFVLK